MAEVFKTRLGGALLGTVHRDPSFSEAQAYGRDPLDPTVNSIGCQDVHVLCRALLERIDSTFHDRHYVLHAFRRRAR